MKVTHVCLCGPYTDGFNYQENMLSIQHKKEGNDVSIIARCEEYDKEEIIQKQPCTYINQYGIKVYRLESHLKFNNWISNKLGLYKNIKKILEEEKPDIIFCHGFQFFSIINICEYVKANNNVKIFVDSHADENNSAKKILSKYVLHKIYYKMLLKKALKYSKKILCVSKSVIDFMTTVYNLDNKYLELYPLGGIRINLSEFEKVQIRHYLDIKKDELIIVHAGKLNKLKKTYELVKITNKYLEKKKDSRIKLLVFGSFEGNYYNEIQPYLNEKIIYKGWVNGSDLLKILSIADVYSQIGSQSASLQNAACCGCALMVYPHDTYTDVFANEIEYVQNEEDIIKFYEHIENEKYLNKLKYKTHEIALKRLDYSNLSKIIYK